MMRDAKLLLTAFFMLIGLGGLSACIDASSPELTAAPGDIIPFGNHDWRILDIQDDYALIITENIISRRYYHHIMDSVTWETSDVRAYLNGDFFYSFHEIDRAHIRETSLTNSNNKWFDIHGGNNTTDNIFLLSLDEVVQYFGDSGMLTKGIDENERGWPDSFDFGITIWGIHDKYSIARIAQEADGAADWWWLRSPGNDPAMATAVGPYGNINLDGLFVSGIELGVRPALWVRLDN